VPGARGRAGHASHAGDAQTCRGQGGRHRGGAEQGAAGEPQGSRQGASRVAARGHAGEAARGAARGAHGGGGGREGRAWGFKVGQQRVWDAWPSDHLYAPRLLLPQSGDSI
jgi:hypothetical protein